MTTLGEIPSKPQDIVYLWMETSRSEHIPKGEHINPGASTSYLWIWSQWCKFVGAAHPHVSATQALLDATPIDALSYLNNGIRSVKSSRLTSATVSEVTRRRYFRVISRIYEYIVAQKWLKTNPFDAIQQSETPTQEKHIGATLSDRQWQACTEILNTPAHSVIDVRNRAVFHLLFFAALTPQEIRLLEVEDVSVTAEESPTLIIKIKANRSTHQIRELTLNASSAAAMSDWLLVRSSMRAAKLLDNNLHGPLFISKKSARLSMLNLLSACKGLITQACEKYQLSLPIRMGPQIIRNTRIVHWLNLGMPPTDVVAMAGLKNGKGLSHLLGALNDQAKALVAPLNQHDKH